MEIVRATVRRRAFHHRSWWVALVFMGTFHLWSEVFVSRLQSTQSYILVNYESRQGASTDHLQQFAQSELDFNHESLLNKAMSVKSSTTPATIVCQLSGELGNHLGHYAHCYALSRRLAEEYHQPTQIVLRREPSPSRWRTARNDLVRCFPHFRKLAFEKGNTEEFDRKHKWQTKEAHLQPELLRQINHRDPAVVRRALQVFVNHTQHHSLQYVDETIKVPFLYSTLMAGLDFYVDEYLDDLRSKVFRFDEKACCRLRPDPDETVFHLRNFLTEMSMGYAMKRGYAELGPHQVAYELLGHLNPGDKVVVVSRFDKAHAQQYLDAMEQRGLQVRMIENQSGVEDFCFLLSTQKELVGISISTYFKWASFLSNSARVIAYSLDTKEMLRRRGRVFFHYNFAHPDLSKRFTYRLLRPKQFGASPTNETLSSSTMDYTSSSLAAKKK